MNNKMRNRLFMEQNEFFRICCKCAKVEPTTRQVSKFRNEKGMAYKFKGQAVRQMLIEGKQISEKSSTT